MKRRLLSLVLVLVTSLLRAAPAEPATLAAAVETAISARDVAALVALTHAEGLSDEDRQKAAPGLAGLLPEDPAATVVVTVDRLPDGIDLARPRVLYGQRIELSAPPVGIIRVAHKQGRSSIMATIPYVRTEAGYLLAGRRSTDLGWNGPRDQQIGFTFAEEFPPMPCAITIRYNASGEELVETATSHSGVLLGQHIEEFTITGLPETFRGRLVLRVGKEEIFRSEPLTGSADYTYLRSAR
jgi:hypothetical protein